MTTPVLSDDLARYLQDQDRRIAQLERTIQITSVKSGDLRAVGVSVTTPPDGWLACDGSAISRTTYASLFNAIGTTWGTGDGSTTFNLPDLRGRVPIGAGTGTAAGASAWTLGTKPTTGVGGEETHALTTAELAAHTHGVTEAAHSHNIQRGAAQANSGGSGGIYALQQSSGTDVSATQSATTGITVNSAGSGTGHNNMQPVAVVNWLVKI